VARTIGFVSKRRCQRALWSAAGAIPHIDTLENRVLLSAQHSVVPHSLGSADASNAVHAAATIKARPAFVLDGSTEGQYSGGASPGGLTPSQIATAYGINDITFGGVAGNGAGQTIAIVDAYDDPTIASDLQAFDAYFGIANPPSFSKVNETGGSTLPSADTSGTWEIEESLDVEWAHALAPDANIVLVEASSSYDNDLFDAAQYAATISGVSAVSMSFAGPEFYSENYYDSLFTTPSGHTGVTFLASSGDNGADNGSGSPQINYPTASPNVISVGGTYLSTDGSGDYISESAWSGSGGGISEFETQPSYQNGVVTQSSTYRTVPDISSDASPSSGVPLYDSYSLGASTPWITVGGTSFASPTWAAMIAIANQGRVAAGYTPLDGPSQTLPALYSLPSSDFHDITSGNNGFAAGTGYDLVTGIGSPVANLLIPALAYYGHTPPSNPPTVATAAAATSNPVTSTTTALSVLGADSEGESALTYTWSTLGSPPASVSFTNNGTNSAKNTTAIFSKVGTYDLEVTILDHAGLSTTSTVDVTVDPTVTTVVVSPTSASLNEDGTKQFSAVADDQFGNALASQPSFSWTLAGGSIGSVNSSGLFTAPAAAGSATVTATANSVHGTATVTVTNATPTVATAAGSSANPVTGTTANLTVLGADDGGESNLTYTWTTIGSPPASVNFSDNGNNAAQDSTATFSKAGIYVLRATITDQGGLSVTSTETLTVNQTLTSISLGPTSATLNANHTQQFTATAFDQFGNSLATQPTYSWSLNGGSVGSLNSTGLFTSPGYSGSATVLATASSVHGSATVTITNLAPTVATPAQASSSHNGVSANLTVLGADDGGQSNLTYTWTTTGSPPASVNFSANGTNAAQDTEATFSKAGSYTFQVTIADQGGLTTTSSVNVSVGPTFSAVVVSPNDGSINENGTEQFAAVADDQFGYALASQPSFTWMLIDGGVGSINSSGLYTGPAWAGSATVEAIASPIGGTATVAVVDAPPTVATPASAKANEISGNTTTLSVLGASDGGESNLTYIWSAIGSSPTSPQFSINGNNAAQNTVVTFDEVGTYVLQVTITDLSGLSVTSSTTVTVDPTVTSISISPTSANVDANATEQFAATVDDQFGTPLVNQPDFTWELTGGSVGEVDDVGLYVAPDESGSATVEASADSLTASATISVSDSAPTVATPAAAGSPNVSGSSTELSALGSDFAGEADLTYTWSTVGDAPAPVNFSDNGNNAAQNIQATFAAVGSYEFQVTITNPGGQSVTSNVDVTVSPVLTTIQVTGPTGVFAGNSTQQFTAAGFDQFSNPMSITPTWSVTGGGSISDTGLLTAPTAHPKLSHSVTAAADGVTGSASFTIEKFATVSNNTLTIVGANGSDTVKLTSDGADLTVLMDGQTSPTFALSTLDAIDVFVPTGNNRIHIGASVPSVSVLAGPGADTLVAANSANDTLDGGAGADSIHGGNGNDELLGGAGADTIIGGSGADLIKGGKGRDSLTGGGNNTTLLGGAGADSINATTGTNDSIDGGLGDNSGQIPDNNDDGILNIQNFI
jgi:RTX calcium-binding nonapeptide repeat (4 copies)/Bacterial Ig-like domain (group 2)